MSNGLSEKLAWTEADPEESLLATVTEDLAREDGRAADREDWPESLWESIERTAAPLWTLPIEYSGAACPRPLLVQRYARLASGSLTAVFILSQHDAALRRFLAAPDKPTAERWLNAVGRARAVATVGISHLTTSRRLGTQAIQVAELAPGRYRLNGTMPWVTAAKRADLVVTGAALEDGRQMLIALPADRPGVQVCPPFALAALQASCTSQVDLRDVEVDDSDLLAGPAPEVLSHAGAVGTGGLETSALALGQARAALSALVELAPNRGELLEPLDVLCEGLAHPLGPAHGSRPRRARRGLCQSDPYPGQRPGTTIDSGLPDRAKVPDSSVASRPSDGLGKHSSFSSGRARRRLPRPPSVTSPVSARRDFRKTRPPC